MSKTDIRDIKMKYSKYSAIIIGSGISGLYAALKIEQQLNLADGLLIVTKSKLGESNSLYAQGGIVGVIKENKVDSTASHNYSVALGAQTKTTATHQIVLGTKDDTVVIPAKLEVNGNEGQMTLGGPNTTIYIPGKLVVDHDVELAKKSGEIRGRFFGYGRSEDGRMWFTFDNLLMMKPSDRRLKNVEEAFTSGLDKIKQLKVYNFTFKNDTNKTPQVGVIAQDLQKVFPNAVTKGEDGFLRIRWDEIFYALVNAVKELDTKVEALIKREQKINELEKQVASLQSDMKKLEKRLAELEKNK